MVNTEAQIRDYKKKIEDIDLEIKKLLKNDSAPDSSMSIEIDKQTERIFSKLHICENLSSMNIV